MASTAEALPEELGMASTQRGADPRARVLETGLSGYLQVQSVRLVVSLQSKLLLAKQGRCRSRFRWGLGVIQVLGTET